eukprot:gene7563-9298_t
MSVILDITSHITLLKKERDMWRDKFIKAIEEHKREVEDLKEKINSQNKNIETLEYEIIQLNLKINNLQSEIKELKERRINAHENHFLGEISRQTEKSICKHILGIETRVNTLSIMFNLLKEDDNAKNNWVEYKKEVKWDHYLYQTILELKERRLNDCHPSKTTDGDPITKTYLQYISNKHIKGRYKQEILDDIKCMVDILEALNGPTLFVRD